MKENPSLLARFLRTKQDVDVLIDLSIWQRKKKIGVQESLGRLANGFNPKGAVGCRAPANSFSSLLKKVFRGGREQH
jgi:hypothetical protein